MNNVNKPCFCGSGRKFKKCCANKKQPTPQKVTMKRHELWRLQYRRRRYLQHLNEDDLITRFNDVFTNQTLLSDELKISFHPVGMEGEYWWTMFTHILEEFVLRGYTPPDPIGERFHEILIPKYDWEV